MSAKRGLPWWSWVPFLPISLALLLLWRLRRRAGQARTFPVDIHRDSIPLPMEPREGDDLTELKGVGLRSAAVLNAHGIYTYAQLAATPVESLRDILFAANLRLLDPTTWPDQAKKLLR